MAEQEILQSIPIYSREEQRNLGDKVYRMREQGHQDWNALYDFRTRRRRARNYYRGNQWGDMIWDNSQKKWVTEESYLEHRGRMPAKNNQIEPIIRNLLGQYRENQPEPIAFGRNRSDSRAGEIMTKSLRYALNINQSSERDALQVREFMLSGMCAWKQTFGWWRQLQRSDLKMDQADVNRLYFNADLRDPRMNDLKRIGYLHDMTIDEVISTFAENKSDAEQIKSWYAQRDDIDYHTAFGAERTDSLDYFIPFEQNKVRVIEHWELEYHWMNVLHDQETGVEEYTEMEYDEVAALNGRRIDHMIEIEQQIAEANGEDFDLQARRRQLIETGSVPLYDFEERYDPVWVCYFFTPFGQLLFKKISPYEHGDPPFDIVAYPMVDGEIYGLVESIIDQQRYINRMISMLDFLITSSAKGVLMVDKNLIPSDMSPEEFTEKFVEFDGVIYYESDPQNPQNMPKHITNQSVPAGVGDLLSLQTDLMHKISGVTGPSMGHDTKANTPASLYAQQKTNAALTTKDIFDSFFAGLRRRNMKALKIITQFWDEHRYINVGGKDAGSSDIIYYDPEATRNVDFDIKMTEDVNSTLFRTIIDEHLQGFLMNKLITFEEYLSQTSMPFADSLLEMVKARKQRQTDHQGEVHADMKEQGMTDEEIQAKLQQEAQVQEPGGQQHQAVQGEGQQNMQ